MIQIHRTSSDLAVDELDHQAWQHATETLVDRYWSGERAPDGRQFMARLLWSDEALYVRFDATQTEPLVVSERPDLSKKTLHLWNRDVCEILIAPDTGTPNMYYEFEVAPTGEWFDLAIELADGNRATDQEYASGMQASARLENDEVIMAISVPWAAFGRTPKTDDVWLGNLFRSVGKGADRGYLAWRPTRTPIPNFHVPSAFGELIFIK
jgi:alpha-galactosidase